MDERSRSEAVSFEAGHAYRLIVAVQAKPGYEFGESARWTLDEFSGITSMGQGESASLSTDIYSFETVIPKVEISNVPTQKAGETARTDVAVPAGANYAVLAEWSVWNDAAELFDAFDGVFEADRTYQLRLLMHPAEGYRFDEENTEFYLDGKKSSVDLIYDTYAEIGVNYPEESAKKIHRVEVAIAKPKTGDHSSVYPVVTIPNGAGDHLTGTGDNSQTGRWIGLMMTAIAGFITCAVMWRRKTYKIV